MLGASGWCPVQVKASLFAWTLRPRFRCSAENFVSVLGVLVAETVACDGAGWSGGSPWGLRLSRSATCPKMALSVEGRWLLITAIRHASRQHQ